MRKEFLNKGYQEKEVSLVIRVPDNFDEDTEKQIDQTLADALYDIGCELVDSKEYKDIAPSTVLRFECNCKTDAELAEMLNEAHKAENGFNFEIGARLWYTPEGLDKTIMVEYDMTTQECRDLVENQDEPDWFTAYEVDDEQDYDCSAEIFTETTDDYISVSDLKKAMTDFAKRVFERFYVKEQCNSLDSRIDAAETIVNKSVRSSFKEDIDFQI